MASTPAPAPAGGAGRATGDLEGKEVWGEADAVEAELAELTVEQIRQRTTIAANNLRVLTKELRHVENQVKQQEERIKENVDKIRLNKQLPYLVANVVEVLQIEDPDEDDPAAGGGLATKAPASGGGGAGARASDGEEKPKSLVIKTTTRQTVYLPVPGLVDAAELKPGELIGVNKDSFLILEKLPTEYDSRVKAMELDEKPNEEYTDIGGAEKQIQELKEAIVLPMTHGHLFKALGVRPPKGVLLHGPPGTGKTLLARACAKSTDAVFLKLAGPSLVQMYIGDGAKMIRDAFDLAKEKGKGRGGAIIFIDEIDAIGTKRQDSEQSGEREVQRTMLELLNQLDGFSSNDNVKVIAATNRPDTLDPALLRSGRLDRKIELPLPDEKARVRILQIHCRKMNVDKDDVNFEELARSTEDFNGAMLKAVCVEGGMIALRREATTIRHEDLVEGIQAVQMKKKSELQYYG